MREREKEMNSREIEMVLSRGSENIMPHKLLCTHIHTCAHAHSDPRETGRLTKEDGL